MKKTVLGILTCLTFLTGCTFGDDFSDKLLYTTMYPIEYAANELYSDYAKVQSVYPNGADNKYEVTQKKKEIYANSEIFIYSGIASEAYLARDMLNINKDLKLIDATKGMDTNAELESIWLDPSNYLMLCSNIKSSLIDYNDNPYVKEAIENNYKDKEKIENIENIVQEIICLRNHYVHKGYYIQNKKLFIAFPKIDKKANPKNYMAENVDFNWLYKRTKILYEIVIDIIFKNMLQYDNYEFNKHF